MLGGQARRVGIQLLLFSRYRLECEHNLSDSEISILFPLYQDDCAIVNENKAFIMERMQYIVIQLNTIRFHKLIGGP